ncbi:sigma-70 family RNA polymerase sigma factor [Aquimarina sp. I32.4]|uniref:sigma-70 family RNA polymerase sigma factor n=1 Tax=Aquimarina sp. I32.4 TaxID=2053903 RepID=UPI000CDE6E03|nr:sigma-70 family RNA polymerase sigma factor [Aquimarina sp. I32.4]
MEKMKKQVPDLKSLEGFTVLYDLHGPKILSFFIHNLRGNKEISEDLLQEIFSKLWLKRKDIEINGPIENYLLRAAKNKLIDYWRKHEKEKVLFFDTKFEKQSNLSPEDDLIYSNTKESIFNLVKKLPRISRNIFFLSRHKSLSNREIADKLNLSERAVEYQISKALKLLRKNVVELF